MVRLQRLRHFRYGILMGIALLALPVLVSAESLDAGTEAKVKVGFMYNFAKFIDWPEHAFSGRHAPLTFCVLGDDPV